MGRVRLLRVAFLVLYAVLIVRTAWVCDDAYISFRTVRNFVAGDGLCWNLGERVQVFTHPLWLLLVSAAYAITSELWLTTMALSLAISLAAAIWLGWRVARTPATGALALALLAGSRSFIDYSTSGMENPLAHLLLVLLAAEVLRPEPRLPRAALWAGLLAANRLDALLLALPLWAAVWRRAPAPRVRALAFGLAPLAAWELFAVFYFGSPFPNTALAKLPEGLSLLGRVVRAGGMLLGSAIWDPLLAVAGLAGFVLAARRLPALAIAVALHCAYLLWAGGDFMAGRFLTAPYLLAVVALVAGRAWSDRQAALAAAAAMLLALAPGIRSSLLAGPGYGASEAFWPNYDRHGIADERGVYYRITGLLRSGQAFAPPRHARFEAGAAMPPGGVVTAVTIGFTGFAAPRDTVIVDRLALADPLLARLPPRDPEGYRTGHVERAVPDGYLESRRAGANLLADPRVARLYDDVVLATRAPLLAPGRLGAIWRLNVTTIGW